MPRYTIEAPDGRRVTIEGVAPPTEQDMAEVFSSLPPRRALDSPMAAPAPTPKSVATRAAEWLPTVMGAGFGMAGGGGLKGAAMAALGGAGGEGYRQAFEGGRRLAGQAPEGELPDSFWGQVKGMGQEAAVQGASELVGQGLGRLMKAGGTALYRKLLKPSLTPRLAAKAGQTVETGMEYGINPFAPKSLGRIEPEISRLGSEVEQLIASHPGGVSSPLPRSPLPIAQRVTKTAEKYAAPGADPLDRAAAARVPQQFLEDLTQTQVTHTPLASGAVDASGRPIMQTVSTKQLTPMTGKEILEARRAAGRSAGGNAFGVTRGAETEARKELYHELGQELGDMYGGQVRGRMGLESRLIDLKDAATAAAERAKNSGGLTTLRHIVPAGLGYGAYQAGSDPTSAATYWLLAEMASNPRMLARAALMMRSSGGRAGQSAAATLPRGFWQLVRSSNDSSPDQ